MFTINFKFQDGEHKMVAIKRKITTKIMVSEVFKVTETDTNLLLRGFLGNADFKFSKIQMVDPIWQMIF